METSPDKNATKKPESSERLYSKVVRGGAWVTLTRISLQILTTIKILIIGMLLTPGDLGLFGIALLTMALINQFTQTGFRSALIQRKDIDDNLLNTAWTSELCRGVILFGLLFLAAPFAAVFFDGKTEVEPKQVKVVHFLETLQDDNSEFADYLKNAVPELMDIAERTEIATIKEDNALQKELSADIANQLNLFIAEKGVKDAEFARESLSLKINEWIDLPENKGNLNRANRVILEHTFQGGLEQNHFRYDDMTLIIRLIGLTFLIGLSGNIGIVYFSKELEFNKRFIYDISGSATDIIITITLAFILRNAWALVWGKLASEVVRLGLSYVLHPYRPRLFFDKMCFKQLWTFGRWVFGSTILGFLTYQADDLFVGALFGATALGIYQYAYRIAYVPVKEISSVFSQISFPAYVKIQDNPERLKEAYSKVYKFTAFLSFPAIGLILFFSHDFVTLFFSPEWQPMIVTLQILAIDAFIRALSTTCGPFFMACNRPELVTRLQFLKVVFLAILIYPLSRWNGYNGTALAVLLSAVLNQPIVYLTLKRLAGIRLRTLASHILYPMAGMAASLAVLYIIRYHMIGEVNKLVIGLLVLGHIGLYFGFIFILDMLGYGIKPVIREQILALRKK